MLGMGPLMMKLMMKQSKVPGIEEFIKIAKSLGVKLIACTTTFGFMGFSKEDFIPEFDGMAGAATFLQEVREGKVSYFI
jgi:peroxiredoxin family protein